MKILTCIVCPVGCKIKIDEEGNIQGARCDRGINFVRKELLGSERILTTTIKVEGGMVKVLPVKSKNSIPKEKLREVVRKISSISVKAPIRRGDVVYDDGEISLIATRSVEEVKDV